MDQENFENSRKKSNKSGVHKKRELRFNKISINEKKNSSDVVGRRRTNKKSTNVNRASNLNKSLVSRVSSVRRFTAFSRQPTLRFQPTYRLEPKRPFKHDDCYSILQNLIEFNLQNYVYNPKTASRLCLYLSEEIKIRVKKLDFDRFKIICVVTTNKNIIRNTNRLLSSYGMQRGMDMQILFMIQQIYFVMERFMLFTMNK